MILTAENTFHNTIAFFEPIETGELANGGNYATIKGKTEGQIAKTLCGMKECRCGTWIGAALGEDGKVYHILVEG